MPTPKEGYFTADGKQVPGVTTIVGRFKASDGLIHWASRLALDPLMQARSLALQELDVVGFLRHTNPDDWDYKKVRGKAADAGTCAHERFDCYCRGIPFDSIKYSSDALELSWPAFEAAKTWAGNSRYQVTESEVPLVSEKYRFGGTRDGVLINDKRSIVDVKTSNSIYPEYLLQIAAYGILDEEHGNSIDGGYHLLRFSKQEKPSDPIRFSHFYWSQLDLARRCFLLMRELYGSMQEIERMTK